jgi:hypothetical protein
MNYAPITPSHWAHRDSLSIAKKQRENRHIDG